MFGHRGFSHSLVFAVLLAVAASVAYRRFESSASAQSTGVYLFLCAASHGLLDALTNGGLGVAFFSPFIEQRYFFPWRPIPVRSVERSVGKECVSTCRYRL